MNPIKKFVDRIALADARQNREIVIPISDAKELRDELLKLLVDLQNQNKNEVVEVVMRGGNFK